MSREAAIWAANLNLELTSTMSSASPAAERSSRPARKPMRWVGVVKIANETQKAATIPMPPRRGTGASCHLRR
jgi:hypothetical protein